MKPTLITDLTLKQHSPLKEFFYRINSTKLNKKGIKNPKSKKQKNVSSLKSNKISFRKQARNEREKSRREMKYVASRIDPKRKRAN